MKIVNEWASLVDRSIQVIVDSFKDGKQVSIRGARSLVGASDARDAMRRLPTDPIAGKLFEQFDEGAHQFVNQALLLKRMIELAPGSRASDHGGCFSEVLEFSTAVSQRRRHLKEKLMEMAHDLGQDLVTGRNGYWEDFLKANNIVLMPEDS